MITKQTTRDYARPWRPEDSGYGLTVACDAAELFMVPDTARGFLLAPSLWVWWSQHMDFADAVDHDRRRWVFRFHLGDASVLGIGSFEVHRGQTRLARMLCTLMRAPKTGSAVSVRVDIRRQGGREVWRRTIGSRVYVSRQVRTAGRVRETIGPLEVCFRVAVDDDGVGYVQERVVLRLGRLRVRLPRRVAPQVHARAVERDETSFFVRVDVCVPPEARLFSYWGVVEEA